MVEADGRGRKKVVLGVVAGLNTYGYCGDHVVVVVAVVAAAAAEVEVVVVEHAEEYAYHDEVVVVGEGEEGDVDSALLASQSEDN